jgi:predicted DNA-binding transcriptional regulator AlpA
MVKSQDGEYLTEREVSERGLAAVKTLQKWRLNGEGPPYVKVGALVRYRRSDLEAWLASRTVTPSR